MTMASGQTLSSTSHKPDKFLTFSQMMMPRTILRRMTRNRESRKYFQILPSPTAVTLPSSSTASSRQIWRRKRKLREKVSKPGNKELRKKSTAT